MALTVKQGELESRDGIIHFLVPVREWYQDLVFT
jgi:hypothetical protein